MFQRHEYHRERDDGNSKYYVNESDRNRDDRGNYNYKTSYNQDRDGNFYAGSRDYARDGGNVEFSRTSTQVRNDDYDRNRGSSGAVFAGSVYSPYAQSGQDANRYCSSSYDSRCNKNQDNQYGSGSAGAYAGGAAYSSSGYGGGQQLYSQPRNFDSDSNRYSSDNNRYSSDNRSSGYSSQPQYYKQETKTYYNNDRDDNQRPYNRDQDYSSSRGYAASGNYDGNRGQASIQYSSSRY